MSFSCPHFDINRDTCTRVRAACVPGRSGCVLQHNSGFAIPVEKRLSDEKQSDPRSRVPPAPHPLPRKRKSAN
jgi:hypothetical protein